MLTAITTSGRRITPHPHTDAHCPTCGQPVRPKCGPIITWHWAHHTAEDCDIWAEPDTEWHRDWQSIVPIERREVVIGKHRADVIALDGTVIELQHSYLPPDQIKARENHYGRMLWLFDARQAWAADRLGLRRSGPDGYRTFRWKHPRKSIGLCRRPVFLDLDDQWVLHLGKIHTEAPCGGWGHIRLRTIIADFANNATLPVHTRNVA